MWPEFLKHYAEAIRSDIAFIQIHDLARHTSIILSGFNLGSTLPQSYNEYYATVNIWRERGGCLIQAGNVNLDDEFCSRAELRGSEFYNDCLLPNGIAFSMGAVIDRQGDYAPTLSALRGPARHPFGETERDIARFLLPHLTLAWAVQQRLELLSAGESVLDTLPLGVVYLSAASRAIYWNRAADRILREDDGLALRKGMLSAVDRQAGAQLRRAICDALSPSIQPSPGSVRIARTSLRQDYQVAVAPISARFRQFTGMATPAAMVLITDQARKEPASVDALVQLYGLTPKEAEVAAKLSEGKSIEQTAGELAITYETARTHLRRIFSKTETSRQADLILLMARLPAAAGVRYG
jgi:DNA-binding CsgD family transcriptional regulator/PAS domain-containing protein